MNFKSSRKGLTFLLSQKGERKTFNFYKLLPISDKVYKKCTTTF